ncbi:DUF3841 domain-containing protein [Pseudarthrobacter sp. H2]|uniref:DUF3841 domain-containing protein n=1 Tax=Pseudarthrobacter sp. H2 TaxID=3418415 RepID=UPI003CF49552
MRRQLLLHTIQTAEAFDALLSTGVLVPDNSFAEPSYADAYGWMLRQMGARLATVGDGAIWFWARIRRQDLVDLCSRANGEVLLTCKVPREAVLLSHFGDWHAALNWRPHVPDLPGESDEEYGARLDRVVDDFDARIRAAGVRDAGVQHWPEDLRTEIEGSWEHVLEPLNYGRFESWQATMHLLRTDHVLEAVRLER